ncbi:MAG: zinc-binding dehydrogenase, partial [Candidatus Asgardarchaeia archaeon]
AHGILAKVRMTTICGSDVNTWQGKRKAPTPMILGHEIIGEIKELGKNVTEDCMGNPLSVGDRITWTIMASCGRCYYCAIKRIPQKCLYLFKYGHESCKSPPHLNGGLAEYIYLKPGTAIFKIPEELSDEEVAPLNCSTATVVHGLETIGVEIGDNVVVQGAGMVGINTVALLREKGAGTIIVLDKDQNRLKTAKKFGADETINVDEKSPTEILSFVKDMTGGYGVDLVVEASGYAQGIPEGVEMLRIGGRYVLIGTTYPAIFNIKAYTLTYKMVKINGIHNYSPHHLAKALSFITKNHKKYPFNSIVTHYFKLEDVEQAFKLALERKALRIAIVP